MPEQSEDKINNRILLLESTRSKVDLQMNADNAVDSKSGTLLALAGAVVIFYLGTPISNCGIFLLVPLVPIGISIYFLVQIINTKEYNSGLVDVYDESKGYREMTEYTLLNQLLSDYQKAFDDNNEILGKKNKLYRNALLWFLIGIALMVFINII